MNDRYIERRLKDADEAEARVDALAGQATRRYVAINTAVLQIRRVRELHRERWLTRTNVDELLNEIACALERKNQMRAADMDEFADQIESALERTRHTLAADNTKEREADDDTDVLQPMPEANHLRDQQPQNSKPLRIEFAD
jgi:hypothetical protein